MMQQDYASSTVVALRKLLEERSLSKTGKKAELIARLEEHDALKHEDQQPESGALQTSEEAVNVPIDDIEATNEVTKDEAPVTHEEAIPHVEESKPIERVFQATSPQDVDEETVQENATEVVGVISEALEHDGAIESHAGDTPHNTQEEITDLSTKNKDHANDEMPPKDSADRAIVSPYPEANHGDSASRGQPEQANLLADHSIQESAKRKHLQDATESEQPEKRAKQEDAAPGDVSHSASGRQLKEFEQHENKSPITASREKKQSSTPSLLASSRALYVKHMTRPISTHDFDQHIQSLCRAKPEKIFLDHFRTHAYIVLPTVEAASQVRNALHGVVWPNETQRKPLWVDYVDSEDAISYIREEENAPREARFELLYESGATVLRRTDKFGIEDANPATEDVSKVQKIIKLDDLFLRTTTKPILFYLPTTHKANAMKAT